MRKNRIFMISLTIISIILWCVEAALFYSAATQFDSFLSREDLDVFFYVFPLILFVELIIVSKFIVIVTQLKKIPFGLILIFLLNLAIPFLLMTIDYKSIFFEISHISERREKYSQDFFRENSCSNQKVAQIIDAPESKKGLSANDEVYYLCENGNQYMLFYESMGIPDGYSAHLYTIAEKLPPLESLPNHANQIKTEGDNWYYVSGD